MPSNIDKAEFRGQALAARAVIGGFLMGLANLVPGISGGTMLLAAGIYPQFINGIAEVSTFRFQTKTILLLACIIGAALIAILGFAGLVGDLVVNHRWTMYSLFIGLTLGGVPILWRMLRPVDSVVVLMSIVGIAIMALMALIGPAGEGGNASGHHYAMYFVAGIAGASAMVLPGISGGYLLLVLGQYVTILGAVANLRDGVQAGNWDLVRQSMHIIIPVGLGVAIGVVAVSNLIKILLAKFERPTLGLLLGLLLGAVIGLWPFQQGVAPKEGAIFHGDRVVVVDGQPQMQNTGRVIEPKDYPTEVFHPTLWQVVGALGLIAAGFATSSAVARLGGGKAK